MPKRTTPFRDDLLADLADPQEAASYLNAALEDSEEMFLVALRDVAEARQMAKVAEDAGIARESIYRMLAASGNPTYSSLLGILHAVGLTLTIKPELPFWNPGSCSGYTQSKSSDSRRAGGTPSTRALARVLSCGNGRNASGARTGTGQAS